MRQSGTWHPPRAKFKPLEPTPPGTLTPCGEGLHTLEFFANPADIPALLQDGITTLDTAGTKVNYTVRLTPQPHYANGDVQIQAMKP